MPCPETAPRIWTEIRREERSMVASFWTNGTTKTLVINPASGTRFYRLVPAQEDGTIKISSTFYMDGLYGTVGPDLAEVFANGHEHTWTLTLHGTSQSHETFLNPFGGTHRVTEIHATSFDLEFSGPDAATLNGIVSEHTGPTAESLCDAIVVAGYERVVAAIVPLAARQHAVPERAVVIARARRGSIGPWWMAARSARVARVMSSSASSVRSTCRTPASPSPSAKPYTYGRPMRTASAPSASAR